MDDMDDAQFPDFEFDPVRIFIKEYAQWTQPSTNRTLTFEVGDVVSVPPDCAVTLVRARKAHYVDGNLTEVNEEEEIDRSNWNVADEIAVIMLEDSSWTSEDGDTFHFEKSDKPTNVPVKCANDFISMGRAMFPPSSPPPCPDAGFELSEDGIPREHYWEHDGEEIVAEKLTNDVFVVLGTGPSLNNYGLENLDKLHSIGTNGIIKTYTPDFVLSIDQNGIYEHLHSFMTSGVQLLIPEKLPNVNIQFGAPILFKEYKNKDLSTNFVDGLKFSNSSGYCAFNFALTQLLAYSAGLDYEEDHPMHIVLFGIDMQNNAHSYDQKHAPDEFALAPKCVRDFGDAARFIKKEHPNITVWNASRPSQSLLRCFPFLNTKQFLEGLTKNKLVMRKSRTKTK